MDLNLFRNILLRVEKVGEPWLVLVNYVPSALLVRRIRQSVKCDLHGSPTIIEGPKSLEGKVQGFRVDNVPKNKAFISTMMHHGVGQAPLQRQAMADERVKHFGYWVCFRLNNDDEFKKLYGSLWRRQEPGFDEKLKAATVVFDTRDAALRFQRRLVNLMARKKVAGRVWAKRFHFMDDGQGGDIGPATAEKKKPISSVLVKAVKAGVSPMKKSYAIEGSIPNPSSL